MGSELGLELLILGLGLGLVNSRKSLCKRVNQSYYVRKNGACTDREG